jgi:hypothetical protein
MQLQIITAHGTEKLREIQTELKEQGIEAPIIVGDRWTTPYFLNQIAERAIAGDKHFLADDCTQFQIRAVMDLRSKGIYSGIPSDFILHLVRQA